nr:hypothetical protein [Thiocystis violacea]
MKPYKALSLLTLTAATTLAVYAPVSQAFNFGNMMNPSRWMGNNNNDRYDDRYDEPYMGGPYGGGPYGSPYGGYGYPGAYGAPYGMPYGMPGFGATPGGYGTPAYGAPMAAPAAPQQSAPSGTTEVEALKRRIEELEAKQQSPQRPPANDWPSAPAFRPMNQY